MRGYGGTLILPSGTTLCVCNTYNVGVRVFHNHVGALGMARGLNENAGFKAYKVVIVNNHFMVVDHTWERNN